MKKTFDHWKEGAQALFKRTPSLEQNRIFTAIALFVLGLGWLGLVLALSGFFYGAILAVYVVLGVIALTYLFVKNSRPVRLSWHSLLIFFLSLATIFIFSYFSSPTIFSGRDQGSLSEAAIRLAENRRLEFSSPVSQEFFRIYGHGKALHFPGFNYAPSGNLVTQFPLGYISWLGVFYAFFGLSGFVIANGAAFLLFLLSFYLLARQYTRVSSAFAVFFSAITLFVFLWFFKFTLGENLALALTWLGILEFVLFQKNKDRFFLFASLASFGLLMFVRIEALAFMIAIAAILFAQNKDLKKIFSIIGKRNLIFLGGILALYAVNIFINKSFYVELAKALLKPFARGRDLDQGLDALLSSVYVMKVFAAYMIAPFLILGAMGILYFLIRKKYANLIPFFIIVPSLVYLADPNISADHPWMLRRFMFSVIPAGILYAVWFLDLFSRRRIYFFAAAAILLAANLSVSRYYLTVEPHKDLLRQIGEISRVFEGNDLILVDQQATGDGWSMMAGPLNSVFGKQAAYFLNPEDLSKMDLQKFSRVYFIIPNNRLEMYEKSGLLANMIPAREYSVENMVIGTSAPDKRQAYVSPVILPAKQLLKTSGKIYIYEKK